MSATHSTIKRGMSARGKHLKGRSKSLSSLSRKHAEGSQAHGGQKKTKVVKHTRRTGSPDIPSTPQVVEVEVHSSAEGDSVTSFSLASDGESPRSVTMKPRSSLRGLRPPRRRFGRGGSRGRESTPHDDPDAIYSESDDSTPQKVSRGRPFKRGWRGRGQGRGGRSLTPNLTSRGYRHSQSPGSSSQSSRHSTPLRSRSFHGSQEQSPAFEASPVASDGSVRGRSSPARGGRILQQSSKGRGIQRQRLSRGSASPATAPRGARRGSSRGARGLRLGTSPSRNAATDMSVESVDSCDSPCTPGRSKLSSHAIEAGSSGSAHSTYKLQSKKGHVRKPLKHREESEMVSSYIFNRHCTETISMISSAEAILLTLCKYLNAQMTQ